MQRRARRVIWALVVVAIGTLALGACGTDDPGTVPADTSAPPTTPPASSSPPSGSAGLLAGYLDELVVAELDPGRPAYDRDSWEEGLDVDGDCVRTRHEVLTDESLVPATLEDCKVVAGSWVDPLTGRTVDDPTDLEVDHLVALADAHRSGGWRWDADRRAAFANALDDPDHLNAVVPAENQRKADDGPESYRPADRSAWCWYATSYARVKATWDLTVTQEQMAGLREMVPACR